MRLSPGYHVPWWTKKEKQHKKTQGYCRALTIPLFNASRRPTWLLWVVPVEVAEQILVQDVAMGYLSTDVQTSRMRWTEKAGGEWTLEVHCRHIHHLLHLKGTHEPWWQLLCLDLEREILGRQPNFLTCAV